MALEEFENEDDERKNPYRNLLRIRNYFMGVLWLGMGIFLLFPNKFGYTYTQADDPVMSPVMKFFAIVSVVYGLFRIYRGYKKTD